MHIKGRGMLLPIAAGMMLLVTIQTISAQERHEEQRERLEARIHDLHERCENGDRRACIRFGVALCEAREHREEWRHRHPEYYEWERERL